VNPIESGSGPPPWVNRVLNWPLDFWFRPISEARLLLWQRVFALTFIIFVAQWSYYGAEWLTDVGYHTSTKATDDVYPTPFPTLPHGLLVPFLLVMFGSATLVMLNLGGRAAKFVVLACAIYIQLVDQISSFTLNKLYIFGFFLLAFAPRPKADPTDPNGATLQSAWPVRVLQATLLIQYGDAGICKIYHGDWLHEVDILYGHSVGVYRTEIAGWLMNHMPPLFWSASSLFALSFEVFAPIFFLPRRTRLLAILAGTAMHLVIAVLMKDLIFFSLQMISFYIVFLGDDVCRRAEIAVNRGLQRVANWLPKREPTPKPG
jgi:hypothetical protein